MKLRPGLLLQSLFYVLSGANHFLHESFYRPIMPDHYSHPVGLIQLTGAAEIAGGLGLLLPTTRRFSAAGLVLLLLVFLDVHWFMLRNADRFPTVPRWVLWARVPLQFVLIAWAWYYARADRPVAHTAKQLPSA